MRASADLAVFVIGGSAGAVDALFAVLSGLPADVTVPIVIAIHQPPGQRSLLPTVLAGATRRPVLEVDDKQPLIAGAIYTAPPNYHVLLERDRTLSLSVDPPVNYSRPSIDVLFESAADAFGPATAGLLLSGANPDGAAGLCQIADAGGWALVQNPATAEYATMPSAALARLGARARIVDELARLFHEDPPR
jgi:two-component system chemotaxis response regulator CheB